MSLLFSNLIQYPLMFPDIPPSGGGKTGVMDQPKSMGKEDVIEFLGSDDEEETPIDIKEKEPKPKEKTKEKEPDEPDIEEPTEDEEETDEDDELKEIEEELEEPDEEKLELVTPVRRKEILKKYPTLFKDFPYLEKAYYREQQFTEIFPTIPDAKEAVDKAETLDKFEASLMEGNTELMLLAAKNASPKAFTKIVDGYLETLSKVDEKAYHHVLGNTIKHTIMSMVTEAKASGNDALQSAALILNQFVFGSSNFVPPAKLTSDTREEKGSEEEDRLTERENAFLKQRFDVAHDDLNTRVNNIYKATIEANIDPRQSMSDYVRRNAVREAQETLEKMIDNDSRFKIIVDKLWEKALEEDFSKSSVDRIRSAFVSKAKTLLPSVIKKARNEALRGMGKRVAKDEDDVETTPKKGPSKEREKDRSQSHRSSDKKVPAGMSSLEFLMADD